MIPINLFILTVTLISDTETLLTPIVLFGPRSVPILKPCVLSVPHSADLRQGNWVIRLLSCVLPENNDETKEPFFNSVWKVSLELTYF